MVSNDVERPVIVDEDLSRDDREIQKKARGKCKKLRELGYEAKVEKFNELAEDWNVCNCRKRK